MLVVLARIEFLKGFFAWYLLGTGLFTGFLRLSSLKVQGWVSAEGLKVLKFYLEDHGT